MDLFFFKKIFEVKNLLYPTSEDEELVEYSYVFLDNL